MIFTTSGVWSTAEMRRHPIENLREVFFVWSVGSSTSFRLHLVTTLVTNNISVTYTLTQSRKHSHSVASKDTEVPVQMRTIRIGQKWIEIQLIPQFSVDLSSDSGYLP